MIDKTEIQTALRLWFRPGDVFEVRVLDAVTAEYRSPHVESGYFDYEHIAQVAEAVAALRSYRGAYVTVNPVKPDLLARAVNRIRPAGRNPTTSDADIVCRRWLLVDCDAERPSGISSSEEEHAAALQKAQEIQAGLSSLGWPEPLFLDSGNGAQLMYAVNLPVNDENLVSQCLFEIAKASDDQVKIDTTVHNPARIWRIPGTMNCKGDSTAERPHRMAKIISIPEVIDELSDSEIRDIIPAENTLPEFQYQVKFDLSDWIRQYCPDLGQPQEWKGGRKWTFAVCPFNSAHDNKSAVLIEQPSGAVAFTCHHNGCRGNDWRKLRELKEPGCYDSIAAPEVNLGALLGSPELPPEPVKPWQEISVDDVEQLLKGTFLGELTAIYASVTRPPLPLEAALMKALVTAACCLTGEASKEELDRRYGGNLGSVRLLGADRARLKINTSGGQVCNIYGMIVANSASGKDIGNLIGKFSRMRNPCIHCADGEKVIADWNLGTSGSAEGLATILMYKPNGLLNISELANWLDPHHWQSKASSFLTEAFGQGYYDQNFSDRGRGSSSRSVDYCCPNIIANIQPNVFEEKVRMQYIDTGFLGRFIFAKMPEFYGNPAHFDSMAVLEQIRIITEVFLRKKGIIELEEDYSDELQKVFLGNCDAKLNPSWRRLCNEYYPRFMVILSVTHVLKTQGESVVITDDTKDRARLLTMWFFAQAEKLLTGVVDDVGNSREVEQKLKRIFEIIRDHDRGGGVLTSEISSKASGSGTTAKQRQELLQELRERRWIQFDGVRYSLLYPPPHLAKVRKKK